MPGIFISYRRTDSPAYAGRLYDHLVNRFGKNSVFMDVDSIKPGVDFVEVLENTVSSCDALIAVIGNQWLSASDPDGCRLDHPEDLVRIEIATALSRNIRVIPALVAGARMPASHELPEALAPLARRNAVEISDAAFFPSLSRLMEALEEILSADLPAPAFRPQPTTGTTQTRAPRPTGLNQSDAPRPRQSPLEKLPRWRKWLLLYRPYSLGGILCRFLFFPILVFNFSVTFRVSPEAYKEAGSWAVIGIMIVVNFSFSAMAQWFDEQAIERRSLRY